MTCNCPRHVGPPAPATVVIRCAECGKVFTRCSDCALNKPGSVQTSMKAHWDTVHARFTRNKLSKLGYQIEEETR